MKEDSLDRLLAKLWLHEPDAATLMHVRAMGAVGAPLQMAVEPSELAAAYADLLLLNVYPYGTAYTDEWGELNTDEAQALTDLYSRYHYHPPELNEVGAPDHLGLWLGFLEHVERAAERMQGADAKYLSHLLSWAPVCCLAAERDPSAHRFYRALAALTRERLLGEARRLAGGDCGSRDSDFGLPHVGDEVGLREVVRYLLAPARCGIFLSRARMGAMANALGMRLPFGSRFEVCEWLFSGAGEGGQVAALLQALHAESEAWASAYRDWTGQYPSWRAISGPWLARVAAMQRLLRAMQEAAAAPVQVN